jgi:hypothetical protein
MIEFTIEFGAVHPYSFDRLYGNERLSLQNMLLKHVNMPYALRRGEQSWDVWSDQCMTQWFNAIKLVKSSQTGDAFFAGVTDESFLEFAKEVVSHVECKPVEVTGACVIRYTNVSTGYPCLRLTAVRFEQDQKRRMGIPIIKPPKSDVDIYGCLPYSNERPDIVQG